MSFCGVVTTRSRAAPCLSATAKYMAVIGAAIPLILSETLTRSSGIPANASSISASVSMAMPTRPTSPSDRGSSESSPSWVGKSKATLRASCPCAIKYLKRAFVSTGVPKPIYCRIVQTRSRYMCLWMPRVNGYSPGRPMSRSTSTPARSSGPYTGSIGNPAFAFSSFMGLLPAARETARWRGRSPSTRQLLERLHDLRQRRSHREHPVDAERPQLVHVARRNGAAHDHRDVAGAVVPQPVEHATREEQVGAGQHRQPDDVHVLLDRRLHDLVRRPLESGVDHLDAVVAQGLSHDFRAAVMPVEPWLGDQHLHASRNAGSQRALPPGSSVTRRGERRTALPIATFAG